MNEVGYCGNGLFAGPFATLPEVVNREPWHGHTNWLPANPLTVHPSCVHVALRAVKVSCAVRATRNVPSGVWTVAMEPTAASTDALSTATETSRPARLAAAVGSPVAGVDGELGPPPHAAAEPRASAEAARQAWAQNSRRV